MAENAFTPYKGFTPADYRLEKERISDQKYMDMQKKREDLFGLPLKSLEPTQRDKDTKQLQDAFSYLGMTPEKSTRFARDLIGRDRSDSAASAGVLDFTPYAPLVYDLPQDIDDFKKAREAGSLSGQLYSGAMIGLDLLSPLPYALLANRSFGNPLKKFAKSVGDKVKGDTTPKIGAFSSILEQPTVKPKMIANTKLQAPSMAMKDPKVVDELGFYSEAERQAKMMQQNKGSGAQFQGMLLNKGVKLDEMKAYGLDELFKNEKVTKKEILDTIDLNKFQLIEKTRIGSNQPTGYEMEYFTDLRKTDGSAFNSPDEIKNAYDTGEFDRPFIQYEDGTFNGFEIGFVGEVLTHTPTKHKIVRVQTKDSNMDEVYFTFKPEANTNDWRNSNEAKQYVDEINETGGDFGAQDKKAETGNLTTNDFDTIVREYAPYSFDEATVRLKANAEDGGNLAFAKFENNTQDGGENYKEFVLSLPPFDKTKGYQDKVDINFPTHFPEFNPVFHIRTKDRATTEGKKVLYVEEVQSDFGQQGRERGFRLKGDDLDKAFDKLTVAEDDLIKLKDIEVKLTPTEVEDLFRLKNPNKVMIDPMDENILTTVNSLTPESNPEIVNPYNPPVEYSHATIEEVAKIRQYQNYKALHKLGDLTDRFFNQLDLSQMGRTQDEIKSEIIKMFNSERLDRGAVTYPYSALAQSGRVDITRNEADNIIKKYYKAKTQTKGESAPIPDAPFVKDTEKWTGLAIKRLLQMAEKGDYDHIAFSPGQVQFDRWREDGLIKYYDEIIPNVARDVTKKMKDKSVNINTTGVVNIEFPNEKADKAVGMSMTADGRYFAHEIGSDRPIEGQYFSNKEEANAFADMIESGRKEKIIQETFAINITPKMKDIVRGGMPLFSTVGGMVGLGALGSMPSTQDGGT